MELRLAEHTGEEVEIVLDFVQIVVSFHLCLSVRIITLATTSSTNEIHRTIIYSERTTLVARCTLTGRYLNAVCDSIKNRFSCVRIYGTHHFVAVVVTLHHELNLTLLHDW